MVISKTPFQSFRLELTNISDCIELIRKGVNTRRAVAQALGVGEKKAEGIFEWAEFLGLLEDRPRTRAQVLSHLGQELVKVQGLPSNAKTLEILYAMIVLNHPLVNRIINEFAYDMSRRFDPSFDKDTFKRSLLNIGQDFDVDPAFLSKRASIYLDLLTSPSNLGRLGILVERADGTFCVNSYMPDWRSAAYIMYASWPGNTSRIRIDELVSGRNSLGRIFFLTEPQIMALLSKLERERAIALEMIADLDQIGLNPSMEARDFLEMLIHDQS
mgnify:CR=1 FL=1